MSKRLTHLSPDDSAELRKLYAAFRSLLERYGNTGEAFETLIARQDLLEAAVRESSEDEANAIKELAARLRRLEELELLRQVGRDDSDRAEKLRNDLRDDHELEFLQEQLIIVTKDFHRAQYRKARLGGRLDLELEHTLEELEAAKERLGAEIEELKKNRRGR